MTATFGATVHFRSIIAFKCSYSGTLGLDGQAGAQDTASETSMSSGNLSTTGTDTIVLCGYAEYSGAAVTSESFAGGAADSVFDVTGGANFTAAWRRNIATPTTGACTATLGAGGNWILRGIAFSVAGGAPATPRRLMLLGVGGDE